MKRALFGFLLAVASTAWAQQAEPAAARTPAVSAEATPAPTGDGEKAAWPEAIEDNSFLVEEAYNQEPGVVQWIFGGLYTRPNDLWALSFTNEWPVPAETHQLSYTASWTGAGRGAPSGLGDLVLNYRYQLCRESKDGVAVAPRLSAILPTGEWRRGLGAGTVGWQVNLPLSKRVSRFLAFHANLGGTYYPGAKSLGPSGKTLRRDLWGTNEGMSVIWLAAERFNLMMETVAYQQEQFGEEGAKVRTSQVLFSPGFRCAFNLPKGQLVLGAAVPVGLTRESPHSGVFLYLSWEAPLWRTK